MSLSRSSASLSLVLGLMVLALSACGQREYASDDPARPVTVAELSSRVEALMKEIGSLRKENEELRWGLDETRGTLQLFCRAYPDVVLADIDAELNAIETGTGLGSFSDFFVPRVYEAFDMGVPQSAINSRLDWLMALLEAGKPMSSSVVQDPKYFQSSMEAMRHLADRKEETLTES